MLNGKDYKFLQSNNPVLSVVSDETETGISSSSSNSLCTHALMCPCIPVLASRLFLIDFSLPQQLQNMLEKHSRSGFYIYIYIQHNIHKT